MASMNDTIVLDSDSEESSVEILVVKQITGKGYRSGKAGNDRKSVKPFLVSTSTADLAREVLTVLSSDVIEKRAREVDALKAEYGEDDAGWGVKSVVTKVYDQDIVSSVVLSILPSLSHNKHLELFSMVAVVGSQHEVLTSLRVFPPLRVRIDLASANNDAKFFLSSSWLQKEHTKRLKNELERRYKKHGGSLLPAIQWLREKSIDFLQISKYGQFFYATPDAENGKPHYIRFHDPIGLQLMFKSISDKVTLFQGTDLASASAFDCPICFDHKASMAAVMFPQCKHYFCRGCVSQDLSLKIKEGQLKDLKCLQHGCTVQVDMNMLKLWVDSTTFRRYCDLSTDQFVDQSSVMVRCPKKECNVPMELAQNAPREVQCPTCRQQFCASCKGLPHPGTPCLTDAQKKQIREEWKAADEAGRQLLKKRVGADNVKFALEDAESEEWITNNAKSCPTCSTPIQKISGCNKMICTSKGCKTYFCWLCGKKLDDKDPYSHFAEAGPCNSKLHTPAGLHDGQRVNH